MATNDMPRLPRTATPAERLDRANYCGPDSARTVPMDTGRVHGPLTARAAYDRAAFRAAIERARGSR